MAAAKRNDTRLREKPQLIADELRSLIVSGELTEGDSLGHEPDLVERFGVSRPSLREALRILEAEGLITVVRGVRGGVVVHEPDERMTAAHGRSRAADAQRRAGRRLRGARPARADRGEDDRLAARAPSAIKKLRQLIREEEEAIEDPERFGVANAAFHEQLVSLAGNQTLTIVAEMLNEIVARAVTAVSQADDAVGSLSVRRRGIRSQQRLARSARGGRRRGGRGALASAHAGRRSVMLGQQASTVVDLIDHF